MALGTLGSTLNDELNRLANGGTYRDMNQMVDEALAAKQWANRENINPYSTDTVGILNEIAGLGLDKKNWLDFNGVCNYIAGTTGLPAAAALRQVYPTTDLLTGVASYYVDATAPTNWGSLGFIRFNGVIGNNLLLPDATALDITGDIDLRARVALDDWTPAAATQIINKWGSPNASYALVVKTTGRLELWWSSNGTVGNFVESTVAPTIADGQPLWIRATLDVDNGASGRDIRFFTSTDGTNWTQLGTTVTQAGTTSIFSGTANVIIGADNAFGSTITGNVYNAQIFASLNGTDQRLDVNIATDFKASNEDTFTATTGQTVTVNGVDTIANLGAAGSLLPTTLGSSTAADSNDPKFLDFTGTNYVYTPGVNNNNLSVPNSAPLQITGDIDLRWYGVMDDWTPANRQTFISKNFSSYEFINNNGILELFYRNASAVDIIRTSTTAVTFADNTPGWVRVTFDVDNGSGGNDVKFWTSLDGTTWTQLGSTVTTAGTTSISTNTLAVTINERTGTTFALAGKVFRAQIFNGIDGTKVLDVDTSTLQTGADAYIVPTTYSGAAGAYFTGTGLSLNGVAGNYVSTPDASQLDITGDIDIAVQVAMADWTPSNSSVLLDKWGAAGQRSYSFYLLTNGLLYLSWTADGTTEIAKASTVATGITDGSTKWVRVTLDVNNGAGGNDVRFFTSDDGIAWTQLGSTVTTAGVTSVFSSTAELKIGQGLNSTAFNANGTFYRAVVKSGIDGFPVFDATFVGVPANSLRMIESSTYKAVVTLNTTRYCTINRSTSGRKTVAVTQPTWLFGTDDYMEVNNRYMSSGTYLYLPGVNGNYASSPNAAPVQITGDIDIRVKVALDDYTPAANNDLLTKFGTGQVSYALANLTGGGIRLLWNDGTGNKQFNSPNAGLTDGSVKWIRATLDVNNGAGGHDVAFFTSDDGTTWTQVGTTQTGTGTTSINNSTAPVEIGSSTAGTGNIARGKFFRAQVLNGINGTVAFDANFETSITSLNQASFTESSANAATVTINRSGSAYRSAGITTAGYLYPGATNTFAASATDFLNFGATQSMTAIAVVRQWATPTSFGRYINRGDASSAAPGYVLSTNGTASTLFGAVYSPSGNQTRAGLNTITAGATSTLGFILDRSTQTLFSFNGTTSSATASTSSVGSLENLVFPFRVGMANGTSYQDFEFIGAAIFRSVLTAAQIRQISNYFANREVYL